MKKSIIMVAAVVLAVASLGVAQAPGTTYVFGQAYGTFCGTWYNGQIWKAQNGIQLTACSNGGLTVNGVLQGHATWYYSGGMLTIATLMNNGTSATYTLPATATVVNTGQGGCAAQEVEYTTAASSNPSVSILVGLRHVYKGFCTGYWPDGGSEATIQ